MFQLTSDPGLVPVNLHILDKLWVPDVEILNLQAFETHNVLSKLEGKILSRIIRQFLIEYIALLAIAFGFMFSQSVSFSTKTFHVARDVFDKRFRKV